MDGLIGRKRAVDGGLRVSGSVRPAHPGDAVDIQQRDSGQWFVIKSVKLRRARFATTLRDVGPGRLRVVLRLLTD